MPSPELMTWISSQRRWVKMYLGRRYYVSCRQLGTAGTKEASLPIANQWWRDKQAEIDLVYRANRTPPRPLKPMEDAAAALTGGDAWNSLEAVARAAVSYLSQLPPSPEAETLADRIEEAAYQETEKGNGQAWEHVATALGKLLLPALLEKTVLAGEPLPKQLAERLPPGRVSQIESAVKMLRGEPAARTARTVKALADEWLATKQHRVNIGDISASRLASLRVLMGKITAFVGETADVQIIDAEKLEGLYYYCLSQIAERRADPEGGWSSAYAREVFVAAKCWIRWLWERGLIEMPKNLNSRNFTFGTRVKTIEIWTVEEVRQVIGKAEGKLKLVLLLALNCGMTQKDASDLLDTDVDWRAGRIIRKRSKTRGREHTPTVNYKLWPATFALLKKHRSGADRVLLTKSGKPFVNRRLVDGAFRAVDSFGDLFRRFAKKIGFNKPMKLLRKTSASLIESHEVYGRFTSLFLGHAPATMKDRHYAAPPQELFDSAVAWLGEQLGVDRIGE